MSFETMLKVLLGELKIPEGQAWVLLEELSEKAKNLDGDKK